MASQALADTLTDIPVAANPAAQAKVLNLSMQHQSKDNWCWAAVSASIAVFYDPPPSQWLNQCAVASAVLPGQQDCCKVHFFTDPCDTPFRLDDALTKVGHLAAPEIGDAFSFSQIQIEIDQGHPLGVRIAWNDLTEGAHFVAISGYHADGNQEIDVRDPLFGDSLGFPLSNFPSNYKDCGKWTDSYQTA